MLCRIYLAYENRAAFNCTSMLSVLLRSGGSECRVALMPLMRGKMSMVFCNGSSACSPLRQVCFHCTSVRQPEPEPSTEARGLAAMELQESCGFSTEHQLTDYSAFQFNSLVTLY